MFAISTYHALNIMIFLSFNYEKKEVTSKEIAAFCSIPVKAVNTLLAKLQKANLILKSDEDETNRYSLVRPPYDMRLAEIIFPMEPSLFTDYLGKDLDLLPGKQAQLLYRKFRSSQYVIEKKMRRCRLSEWAMMDESDLYSF